MPTTTPYDMALLIRRYIHGVGFPSGAEVLVEDIVRALPEHRAQDITDGVTRGVIEGWWRNGPLGRIVLTDAGGAAR